MPTEYDYQKECDNIDEDRQERRKKEKAKSGYLKFKRWKKSLIAEKTSKEVEE